MSHIKSLINNLISNVINQRADVWGKLGHKII